MKENTHTFDTIANKPKTLSHTYFSIIYYTYIDELMIQLSKSVYLSHLKNKEKNKIDQTFIIFRNILHILIVIFI